MRPAPRIAAINWATPRRHGCEIHRQDLRVDVLLQGEHGVIREVLYLQPALVAFVALPDAPAALIQRTEQVAGRRSSSKIEVAGTSLCPPLRRTRTKGMRSGSVGRSWLRHVRRWSPEGLRVTTAEAPVPAQNRSAATTLWRESRIQSSTPRAKWCAKNHKAG